MNLKAKLKRLEEAARPAAPVLIGVHWQGEQHVMCNGRKIPLEEWQAMGGKKTVVRLNWGDTEPL